MRAVALRHEIVRLPEGVSTACFTGHGIIFSRISVELRPGNHRRHSRVILAELRRRKVVKVGVAYVAYVAIG